MSPVDVMLKGRKRLKNSESSAKEPQVKSKSKSSLHLMGTVVTCDEGASPNIMAQKR
jgi:hypothetical protein